MPDGMGREFAYLSSHATNRYFIPNWGKLGASHSYYLNISTQLVGSALGIIIAEVNEAQSVFSADKDDPIAAISRNLGFTHVKSVLGEAWKATKIMDDFE